MGTKKLGVMDAMFLASEARESMMHVGALLPFSPPADAPPNLLRTLIDEIRTEKTVHPPWNLKLKTPDFLSNPLQAWVEDTRFDAEYHVRRSALPSPGDERELGVLVSRLHSNPMDFHRPLWELHIIEGLAGGRFALYFKIHHALADGYTAVKLLVASMAKSADDRDTALFFSRTPRARAAPTDAGTPTLAAMLEAAREQFGVTKDVGRALLNVLRASRDDDKLLVGPMQAPKSILNQRISRTRRFATQSFALARMKRVAKAAKGTLNDVLLALSGAALRHLLLDLGALPDKPLIAMVPVSIRPKDDPGGGNAVAAILASLATDVADPARRLEAIIGSTQRAKSQLQGMSKGAILQYSALLLTPLGLQQMTGTGGRVRPAFNVVISNVPGSERPLFFRGAHLDAAYPLSIPFHGYGLNITAQSYVDTLNIGFTGCRDTVPHLQRLAVYSGEALDEMERAFGLESVDDHEPRNARAEA